MEIIKTKKETLVTLLEDANKLIKTAKKGSQSIKSISNTYGKKFLGFKVRANSIIKNLEQKISSADDQTKLAIPKIKENLDIFFEADTEPKVRISAFNVIVKEYTTNIEPYLNNNSSHIPSDDLFPLELISNTKSYIETTAKQASGCYDHGYFDASAVMTRKLLETLIIECFEAYNISKKIKNSNKDFLSLSNLINKFLEEDGKSWNVGRNTRTRLPKIKSVGDQSAHSRKYTARKNDLDRLRDDLRIVIEELVTLIKNKNLVT